MPSKKSSSQSSNQEEEILSFLKKTNRPYSTNELSNYFQGKYTKNIIQKELDKLLEQQTIISKAFGKTIIYTLKQDNYSEEENQQLDTEIQQLQVQLNTFQEQIKEHQQTLKQLTSTPTTDQAETQLEYTDKVNERMSQDLEKYKTAPVANIPLSEQEKIDKEFAYYRKVWKDRRSLFYEILGTLLENLPVKKEVIFEEIDFEDDPIPFSQDPLIL